VHDQPDAIGAAQGGTLLLDEVADVVPMECRPSSSGSFRKRSSSVWGEIGRPPRSTCGSIAATNRDLAAQVAAAIPQ
jgi:transcriptional regulator with GAF, ATPase, and Fis domain